MKDLVYRYMGEQEALKRQVLTADKVSQDTDGLKELIVSTFENDFKTNKMLNYYVSPHFRVGRHIVLPSSSVYLSQIVSTLQLKTLKDIFKKLHTNIIHIRQHAE